MVCCRLSHTTAMAITAVLVTVATRKTITEATAAMVAAAAAM